MIRSISKCMRDHRNWRIVAGMPPAFIAGIALTLGIAVAQPVSAAPEANAADILDKYVQATGGKAAYAKVKNRVVKMTVEPVGSGMKLKVTNYVAAPNKGYSLIESDVFGQMEKGTDGNVVWETNMMTGPVVKEGEERELVLRAGYLQKEVEWRKLYPEVKLVGVESVGGKACYKIVMTPKKGSPEVRFYEQESGLLAKVELSLSLPMGTIPVEMELSDYKAVDGVLISHKAVRRGSGQEVLIITESIKHNVDIPADRFKLPDDVKALVEADEDS